MDDHIDKFLTAQRAFSDRVHAITEDQWQAPTPDTDWSVADLVSHVVDEHRWAAPLLHGHDLATSQSIVEGARSLPVDGGVGANLAAEWDEAALGSADALRAPDALDQRVELSRGSTPARAYLEEMIFDLTVHSWDLATAIGFADPLPDDLVAAMYESVRDVDLSSFGDMFAKPVDVPDDAPMIDKLVARTGREPR